MSRPLTIYKASAGSGKTFTLATEYIKLLVRNPQSYRQTLAVTFTNKATEEMKMRILSQLYGIWRQLDESRNYINKVCDDLDLSPEIVSKRAGQALHLLLHNYSYFRVETIDSFFQSVLRNLARELDLTANLRIGLNDVQVEELAVDQLIDNLTTTDLMLKWLLGYIMDNISDDRTWNVIGKIKSFGRTIFRDYYKQYSRQLNETLSEEGFFDSYVTQLRTIRSQAKERMTAIADSFFDILDSEGLSIDDFSYGRSGVAGLFVKLQQGVFDESVLGSRATDCVGQPDKWCKKTHPRRELIMQLADTSLDVLLRQAIDEQPRQWHLYKSADLTLHHLSQLRLLGTIEQRVRQLNQEANRFLLSDTQQLLHDLIEGSDSPFIFEKIGTQLEHIMIDEFQDTSTVQWQNFKVLLEEAMSRQDSSSLIVGDVKQSIYRWRSGDWRLLAGIRQQFDHADERLDVRTLDTNYRSCRRIVEFNNAFFTQAARQENLLSDASLPAPYDDVVQQVPDGKPREGTVEVRLLPPDDYQQQTLDALTEHIRHLTEQGVAATDIAILVRANNYIPLIANHFMEHLPEVSVVSDEAFRLDASPAVMTIVLALRFLAHPDDFISRACLCNVYSGHIDGSLPPAFEGHEDQLQRMPLYELCELLYTIFSLHRMEGQEAYLCAFFDYVAQFANEQTTYLPTFLREWDETLCAKTIQSPELNGIRIISIHKSKGLEFPHVIVPFCDWRMEHADILWCHPDEEPFSQLPVVPIDYSQKGMTGTIYEDDYNEEHLQTVVDNMNLLYVAFTRASKSLLVLGKKNAKGSRSALIEEVLPLLPPLLNGSQLSGDTDPSTSLTFTYGCSVAIPQDSSSTQTTTPAVFPASSTPVSPNPFLRPSTSVAVTIEPSTRKMALSQSLKSQRFAMPTDPSADEQRREGYIQAGNVLHEVFSHIRTTADIPQALQQMEQEGIIYDRQLTPERLQQMIRSRLSDPRVADWFSPRWKLFNECTILSVEPNTVGAPAPITRRPDRVMTDGQQTIVVDFKFGTPQPDHQPQVQQYMQLLQQMQMPQVRGYLWYVYSNKIIEVPNAATELQPTP